MQIIKVISALLGFSADPETGRKLFHNTASRDGSQG
jgi:hypothetical protein